MNLAAHLNVKIHIMKNKIKHHKAAIIGIAAGIAAMFILMSTFDYYWWNWYYYHVACPGGSIGIRI
jgi:riboflavin transporter FmnP